MSGIEQTLAVNLEAPGVDKFTADLKKSGEALKQQSLGFRENSLALEKQIQQLRAMEEPDKKALARLEQTRQQLKLNIAENQLKIAVNQQELAAAQALAREQENLARAQQKLNAKQQAEDAKRVAQAMREEAAAAAADAKAKEALARAAQKQAEKNQKEEAKQAAQALREEADAAAKAAKEQENLAKAAEKALLKQQAEDAKRAAQELKELEAAEKATQKTTQDLSQSMLAQTAGLIGATAAIGGLFNGIKTGIQNYGDFECTLNTIQAVSQATVGDMKAVKQASLDLGQSTVFSAQEVADTFEVLLKAGADVNQAMAEMPGLLDFSSGVGR